MKFSPKHAKDVAMPSACLLADRLAPHVTGQARDRLVRMLAEHLMTTLRAYAEFHPQAVPTPSRN